eukprot:3162463-Prymnesium_polylepis.1
MARTRHARKTGRGPASGRCSADDHAPRGAVRRGAWALRARTARAHLVERRQQRCLHRPLLEPPPIKRGK